MNIRNLLLTLTLGGSLMGSAMAWNPNTVGGGPGNYDPGHPRVNQINQREQCQQNRIANGIHNGHISPYQTAHLERQEGRFVHNEKRDMAMDGGHLTKYDQMKLNHEANHVSRDIYLAKH